YFVVGIVPHIAQVSVGLEINIQRNMTELFDRSFVPMIGTGKDFFLEGGFVEAEIRSFDDEYFVPANNLFAKSQHPELVVGLVFRGAPVSVGIIGEVIVLAQVLEDGMGGGQFCFIYIEAEAHLGSACPKVVAI